MKDDAGAESCVRPRSTPVQGKAGARASEERPVQPSDILRNNVKEKLARGEVVSSMTVRLVRGIEIARIAKTAGFDSHLRRSRAFEPLDRSDGADLHGGAGDGARPVRARAGQHARNTSRACSTAARSASSRPTCARPRRRAPWWRRRSIRRSAAAARRAALPHLHYRTFPAAEANAALDAATMVIVQFESWEAVEKAEEIVAVEGVDMVLIGANDLLARPGAGRPVRARQGARGLRPHHRRLPASTASTWASAAWRRGPSSSPSSSRWARATSRPARTSASCWPKPPSAPNRCRTSRTTPCTGARRGRGRTQHTCASTGSRASGAAGWPAEVVLSPSPRPARRARPSTSTACPRRRTWRACRASRNRAAAPA